MNRYVILLAVITAIPGFAAAVIIAEDRSDLREQLKQPTYHCDGSETRGFADPGTPEAAACWFEMKE
jgi:hypothetical protein